MIKKILLFICLFLFFLFFNLIVSPVAMDEVWVYGFTNNMYLGLVPYRDFNIIIPPLFFFIMSLPFHIFGSSMLVFHIENALLIMVLLFLIYKLIGKKLIIVLPFFIFPFNSTFPNYNFLLLVLFVLLLYLEDKKKSDFLIGIIIGLLIMTKQTVGVCMILPSLYFIKDKKKIIKRFSGFIIPCLIFLIYLLVNNTLSSFIDLGFLGLFDFGNNNQGLLNIYFFIVCILVITNIYLIIKNKNKLPLFYLLAFVSIAIPIFDLYHVVLYVLGFIIVILYLYEVQSKHFYFFMMCFFLIVSAFSIISCDFDSNYYPNNINHFEYRYLNKNTINNIEKYNEIIKNNNYKFFIVGSEGYFHKITLDQKATFLEMPCGGNYGYNGYQKMINIIKKLDSDTLVLVGKSEFKNSSQIYKELFNYIEDNYQLVNEDELYYFYMLK